MGVSFIKGKYVAQMNGRENGYSKTYYIGQYDTAEEAFLHYKDYKEKYIKKLAEEYRDNIPEALYEAMMNWKVEITD